MCVHGHYKAICGHDYYSPLSRDHYFCSAVFIDEHSGLHRCGSSPTPSSASPPPQVIFMGNIDDFCDSISCGMAAFKNLEQTYQDLERKYIKIGIHYWISDPQLLQKQQMISLNNGFYASFGSCSPKEHPTKEAYIIQPIQNIRGTQFMKPFQTTVANLESMGTHLSFQKRTVLTATEVAKLKKFRREGIAPMKERMGHVNNAMSVLDALRAVQQAACLQSNQRVFNFAKNWDGIVSWVSSLPTAQKIVGNNSITLEDYALQLFKDVPLVNRQAFKFHVAGHPDMGYVYMT